MLLKEWLDCYVRVEGTYLRVGNAKIERCWSFASGRPVNVSILDKHTNQEWLAPETETSMFQLPGVTDEQPPHAIFISNFVENDFGISQSYLQTNVDIQVEAMISFQRLTLKIYPNAPFIRHEITVIQDSEVANNHFSPDMERTLAWTKDDFNANSTRSATALQLDTNNKPHHVDLADYCEQMVLRDLHCRWTSVQFLDQTDTNNNLVSRDTGLLYVNEKRSLQGNLLFLTKTLHESGLLIIKEGPTPLGIFGNSQLEFQFRGKRLSLEGTGISEGDLQQKEDITSYGVTVGVYDGTMLGGYTLLETYHRNLRAHNWGRDSFMMSNTWGDRSKDGAISESFLIKELQAAAALGLSIMQIDDGWQKGATVNSVHAATKANGGLWSDYYSGDGDFWEVHPDRFPNGLAPIVSLAKELGVDLGLWYSPDSVHDNMNWERDIATLLHLHRNYNIRAFKLDGIELRSKLGETRLLNMMRYVQKASNGQVDFNIDTTAQKRLGYFGQTQYGSIFLENRYTDWKNYYPHWTLRNLWMLAPYLPSARLQMEFLNVNRNTDNYAEDPLAPNTCGQVYAFAATAFSNPLAWMELTKLTDQQMNSLSTIIQALKPYHAEILAGQVLPIGEEPSGASWTGMQSICSPTHGYVLIYRELHESDTAVMKLWGVSGEVNVTELMRMDVKDEVLIPQKAHHVTWESTPQGEYVVTRPAPFTFIMYRYDISSNS
ncbi:alpha-galactosidase [Paenibacillus qinlingensis]|uniref:alpha-galactosidase n=1 Tax=Paenibacillus qinlingensis TaxID=1837343 RepID=UPI00156678D3|nr:alpha-galactosidase [Paenibacillus qinlingensis]NQX58300.1 alpha-galactosidase [Paenibacillus qinlingensis]